METGTDQNHNLNYLFDLSCHYFSDRPSLGMALGKSITYKEFHDKVMRLASVLVKTGIENNDRIAILAENSPQWGIAYFAIIRIGAVAVPILPDFPASDIHHILNDTSAKILFISSRQMEKIFKLESFGLKKLIVLDNYEGNSQLPTVNLNDFLKEELRENEQHSRKLRKLTMKVDKNSTASIIYTSGTSGHSKGVMLSHCNFYTNVVAANKLLKINPEWTFLSLLPISHAYEFTIGFLLPILNGCRIVYSGKPPTPSILENICRREKPDAICIVPMIIEKIYKKRILKKIEKNLLLGLILSFSIIRKNFYKMVKKKLITFFGGNLKVLAIGGAPINKDAEKFLKEANLPYLVGYGLTETSPLLAAGPFDNPNIEIGSCGRPLPGVKIKIKDPDPINGIGEVTAKGSFIMQGYYNNPELTAETIDPSGYLATGDLGKFNSHGNLHIKGRCKNVIVMANGENIYPEAIEEKINSDIYVMESLVKERNGNLEARIYLDYELIDQKTAGQNNSQRKESIENIMQKIKERVNKELPPYSRINHLVEHQEPFIKTATNKIKRYLYL